VGEDDDNDDEDLYARNLPSKGRPPPSMTKPTSAELATVLTLREIARLVGEGIAAV